MYDIRQFKPTLYVLLLVGVTGFALAAESPGLWIAAVGMILLNAWLVKSGRFVPIPRWLANAVTMGLLGLVIVEFRRGDGPEILTVGEFIVLLHVIKLFEQRANRDYAQLLILSLFLMVAAAISTARLDFGVLFIGYIFLSMYTCLLFHLKVETDRAQREYGGPAERINPGTLRQDQRHLGRSMRRMSVAIAAAGVGMAVFVFLFWPRGSGPGMFSRAMMTAHMSTGFSSDIVYGRGTITPGQGVVARVELFRDEQPVKTGEPVYLRGIAYDVYDGQHRLSPWSRSKQLAQLSRNFDVAGDEPVLFDLKAHGVQYRQRITLYPTGNSTLFAMPGIVSFTAGRDMLIRYSSADQVMECSDAVQQIVQYSVISTGEMSESLQPPELPGPDKFDPVISSMARDIAGLSSDLAAPIDHSRGQDELYAQRISTYLKTHYRYSLDTGSAAGTGDPIVQFLTVTHEGYCIYFAGAMTLMCQSIGIHARLVGGYRCDAGDFNALGDYYAVQQSDGHSWVEVLLDQKWKTFDPTSNITTGTSNGILARAGKLWDYLEFKWQDSVVAYDVNSHDNIVSSMDNLLTRYATTGSQSMPRWVWRLKRLWARWVDRLTSGLYGLGMLCLIGGMAALAWFAATRIRLRRRVRRIGLESMPAKKSMRLVKQLGFYDDLIRILDRHEIHQARHQTPLEFSRSLAWLPSDVYDDIRRLTGMLYRIRYGEAELSAARQRRLTTVVHRVERAMEFARK